MRLTHVIPTIALALAGVAVTAAPAQAQVVQEVSFQGRLTNAGGTPITATTSITFQLYTQAAGGSSIWTETQNVTPNANGVYSVRLGSVTAFPGGVTWNATYYLGLTVSSDAEMVPRYQLTSSAFALRASRIGGLTNTGLNASVTDANLNALTGGGGTSLHTHVLADGATDVTVTATILNQLSGSTATVTGANLSTLTGGGNTNLHTHLLADGATDVTVSAAILNQLNGAGASVTGANLTTLTGGGATTLHTHLLATGATDVTVGATILNQLTGSSVNVTGANLSALTGGANTSLHTHLLADGATDVTVTATILNQLSGSTATVTGANLSALTGGGATSLHTHFGQTWSGTSATHAFRVDNNSTAALTYGLDAEASSTTGAAVRATNLNLGASAIGVLGISQNGSAIYGQSPGGVALRGLSTGAGTGVLAQNSGAGLALDVLGRSRANDTMTLTRIPTGNSSTGVPLLIDPPSAPGTGALTVWKVGGISRGRVTDLGRLLLQNAVNVGTNSKTIPGIGYNYFTDGANPAPSSGLIAGTEDVFIKGDLEVDQRAYLDGGAAIDWPAPFQLQLAEAVQTTSATFVPVGGGIFQIGGLGWQGHTRGRLIVRWGANPSSGGANAGHCEFLDATTTTSLVTMTQTMGGFRQYTDVSNAFTIPPATSNAFDFRIRNSNAGTTRVEWAALILYK